MGYINYGLIPGGDQNCCEKWLKPFLKYLPFHSPWFKPWAMKKRKPITVSTVFKSNNFYFTIKNSTTS